MQKLVSINIVTHNRAHYLAEAIQSVLNQSYQNWELIIVDDASTDNTKEVVDSFLFNKRIKYFLVEKQASVAAVRNLALAQSSGEYLAVLDSDDKWIDENKLLKQVVFLEKHPDCSLLGGSAEIIDADDSVIEVVKKPTEDKEIRAVFLEKNPFFHSSILTRLQLVKELGGYDEQFAYGDDMDLCLMLGRDYKVANLPDILISYRRHSDNEASKHVKAAILGVFNVIAKNRKAYNGTLFIYFRKVITKIKELFS